MLQSLCTIDTAAGRVNPSVLSQQQMMELLLADVPETQKDKIQCNGDEILDICAWTGIVCDSDEQVIEIHLPSGIGGTVVLDFMPPSTRIIGAVESNVMGTIDMCALPEGITKLDIAMNHFHGSCYLRSLPSEMKLIFARSNEFSGSLHLDTLPGKLEVLDLRENMLSGSVILDALPAKLRVLDFRKNRISGHFRLLNIQPALETVIAAENCMEGTAVVGPWAGPVVWVKLGGNKIKSVVNVDGKVHSMKVLMMRTN